MKSLRVILVIIVVGSSFPATSIGQVIDADAPITEWPQLGRTSHRNNAIGDMEIAEQWNIETKTNVKWSVPLGSQTYGHVVIADKQIYVGTNNGSGYLKRYPVDVDLGVLLAFREEDGTFLWQYSSEKLPQGRVHDWPLQGICSAPIVEGDRLWFVSNRGHVVCLDTQGFYDRENDGHKQDVLGPHEADVVWQFDMMAELGVRQHNMATCAPTIWGDALFVCTSNGVDEGHVNIPAPDAPSFIALHKHTAEILWTDNSPGRNILHGQWSCPAVGVLGGVPQVLFAGGDGWLYSFRADRWELGKPHLLWKFDGNAKDAEYILGRGGTRNEIVAVPVIDDGLVYLVMGQDPEHGEGPGHLWCIDPTKRGDVSPQLLVDQSGNPVPPMRNYDPAAPYSIVTNPNSAARWDFAGTDFNGDGTMDHEFGRTLAAPAIHNDLLVVNDLSGFTYCLHAKTGELYWICDLLASCWSSPLIVGDRVYVVDEDGDVAVLKLSIDPRESMDLPDPQGNFYQPRNQMLMRSSIYTTPTAVGNVLYITERNRLWAIAPLSQ